MVGYSLGGLIARYAIGLLHHRGIFDRIQPVVCIAKSRVVYGYTDSNRTSQPSPLPISAYEHRSKATTATSGTS
jgi:hypothetical protein